MNINNLFLPLNFTLIIPKQVIEDILALKL